MRKRSVLLLPFTSILVLAVVLFGLQDSGTSDLGPAALGPDVGRACEPSSTPALAQLALVDERRGEPLPPQPTLLAADVAAEVAREITGIVTLADGTPVKGMRLVALHPDAPPEIAVGRRSALERESILGELETHAQGRFALAVGSALAESGAFYLHQVSHDGLGQEHAIHRVHDTRPLHLVLPGSALDVRVFGMDGLTAAGIMVYAQFQASPGPDPGSAQPRGNWTDAKGRVRFYFDVPAWVRVTAQDRDTGAFASSERILLDPRAPKRDLDLFLSMHGRTGRFRLEVVDQNSVPVRDFRVLVWNAQGYTLRQVDSDTLGPDGLVDGLPQERVTVGMTGRIFAPPHLYERGSAAQFADLRREGITTLRFQVTIQARFAFDLKPTTPLADELVLRYRHENDGPSGWTSAPPWQFRATRGLVKDGLFKEAGRYYTNVLPPGSLWVELHSFDSKEVEWSGRVQLVEGTIALVEVVL